LQSLPYISIGATALQSLPYISIGATNPLLALSNFLDTQSQQVYVENQYLR